MAKVNAKYLFVDLDGTVVQAKESLVATEKTEDHDKKHKDGRIL